eukprot:1168433-Amphidinium_carterae.1
MRVCNVRCCKQCVKKTSNCKTRLRPFIASPSAMLRCCVLRCYGGAVLATTHRFGSIVASPETKTSSCPEREAA